MVGMAFTEVIFLLLLGGVNFPMGLPPGPEDPLLAKIAPDPCLMYITWSGMAKPDPASTNKTELLLAEKEVQAFVTQLETALMTALNTQAKRGPEQARVLAAEVPKLAKAVITKPGAIFIEKIGIGGGFVPQVEGGLLVNLGDEVEAMKKVLAAIEKIGGEEVKTVEVAGNEYKTLPIGPGGPTLHWGFRGRYLIAGLSEKSIQGILARGRGEVPKWLTDIREQLPVGRRSSVAYLNTKAVMTLVSAFPVAEPRNFLNGLGMDNVEYIASVTGLDDTGCITRTRVATDGKPKGIFALADGKPLAAADLAVIPRDATLSLAVRLDPDRIFQTFRTAVAAAQPGAGEMFDQEVNQIQEMIGLKLSDDIFQTLGDTWRVYNSPSEGGLVVTGLTAVASVRDKGRLENALEKIAAFVQKMNEGREVPDGGRLRYATIKTADFNGKKFYFLNFVGSPEMPFAPAWCLDGDQFVIATFPAHVKAYLARGKDFKSLAAAPHVQALLAAKQPPVAVGVENTPELLKSLYPAAQLALHFMTSELQREGLGVDIGMLPTYGTLAKHVEPATLSITSDETGVDCTTRRTLPVGLGALAPVLTMPAFMIRSHHEFHGGGAGAAFPAAKGGDTRDALKRIPDSEHWLPREWLSLAG